jgi:hypothetical protein
MQRRYYLSITAILLGIIFLPLFILGLDFLTLAASIISIGTINIVLPHKVTLLTGFSA